MINETGNNPEMVAGVGMMVAAYVDELAADNTIDALKQAKKASALMVHAEAADDEDGDERS